MPTALSVESLWWRYPTFSEHPQPWLLRGINLQIEQGECFGITGPSGAGKTTLCRTMLGILPGVARLSPEQLTAHFRGSIAFFGETVTEKTTGQMGMVLQDPENQFLRMSLLHELGLGLQMRGLPSDQIAQRAYEALCRVGLDQLWRGAAYIHPSELSGGQKQRVAIASFLALRPRVLVLDEPTSDLDPVGKREVIATLAHLRREHDLTVILVEQDPDILATFCDRIALLHSGYIELTAPPAAFYSERRLLESCGASAGELPRISWQTGLTYHSHPPLTLDEAEAAYSPALARMERWHTKGTRQGPPHTSAPPLPLQQTMSDDVGTGADGGRVSGPSRVSSSPNSPAFLPTTPPVVESEGVWYEYEDGTTALRGVDLALYRGEMLALLGPNGSGKTTLAKILAGIYRPRRGSIRIMGREIRSHRERVHLPSTIGYVFQNPDHQLFSRSVMAEITSGLKNIGVAPAEREHIAARTLEDVGLAGAVNEDPLFLSKGQRQRLAVAAVLAMGPEILIVDEPTTGQDARSIAAIMRLLCELQEQGKTILLITHDMSLVAQYCQRVVAFREGKVSFSGSPSHLFESAELLEKTGLYPPASAALTTRMRAHFPALPSLLTVEQWCNFLRETESN